MKRCDDYTDMGGMRDEFLTTHWSIIEDVTLSEDEKNRALISLLIQTYWKPVYSYLRRRGYNNEQAKDLTQGFFHEVVLGRKLIAKADHTKGSFRSFLLVSLNRYANDMRDAQAAKKRIPGNKLVYLDQIDSPDVPAAVKDLGPEDSFNYTWIAQQRCTEAEVLTKRLRKELEWIPLKAIRKEREHRYQSASELANDIRNYLSGLPVIAGPESVAYRFKKYVQRHKTLVTGAAAVIVVLLGGIIVSTLFAIGQARARSEAQQQARISEAVSDFLRNDLLASVDPHTAKGRELTAHSFLDIASERLEGRFKDEPLVEAAIRVTLADSYRNLCTFKKAEYHQMRALEIYREHVGEEHPDMLKCLCELGWLYWRQGRYKEGEEVFVKIVERGRRVLGREHPSTLLYMNGLGLQYFLLGRYEEAESVYLEVLEISRRVSGEEHDNKLLSMGNLALLYEAQGRYDEAESLFLKTLETGRRVWGPEHPFTLDFTLGLGMVYRDQSRYQKAEQVLTDVLASKRRTLGAEHVYTLWAMNELADLYIELSRYDEAQSLLENALQIGRRVSGEKHPFTLSSLNGLAVVYIKQGDYDKAEPLLIEAVEGRRLKLGDTHPHTIESLNNLIDLYETWGKTEMATQWRAKLPPEQGHSKP